MLTDPSMYLFFCVAVFLLGLCIGSFLNVCIWRIPRGESVILKPSHCTICGRNIKWYENIPVASWIFLRGKCSGCGSTISVQYPVIELLTGFLFLFDYIRVVGAGFPVTVLVPYVVATCLFVVTFVIDLKKGIIPNQITYGVILISLFIGTLLPESIGRTGHINGFLNSFLGAVAGGSVGASISIIGGWFFKKEVFGGGDVKFLAAVGACFGFSPPVWFFTVFVASLFGVTVGIFLLLSGRKKLTSAIAFGPYLAVAGYLWVLCGPELVSGYFSMMEKFVEHLIKF